MFCDHCGAQLQSGQSRCGRCGKTVFGLAEFRRSRVHDHVRLVGILWLAYSALHAVGGVVLLIVAKTIFGNMIHLQHNSSFEASLWLRPLLSFIGWLILAKAAAGFAAGWGLLQREEWGRTVALVVGFIALLSVPLGTALGVYTLWVLLPRQSDEEYKSLAQAA